VRDAPRDVGRGGEPGGSGTDVQAVPAGDVARRFGTANSHAETDSEPEISLAAACE
jgi:hypothetical protein